MLEIPEKLPEQYVDDGRIPPHRLSAVMYSRMHRLATTLMRRERRNHTLQVTGLVNEAWTRVLASEVEIGDTREFYATSAKVMRHVLVDYAKSRAAKKRGGSMAHFRLEENEPAVDDRMDVIELSRLIEQLAETNVDAAHAIELYYFVGFTLEQTARVMRVSPAKVGRDLRLGKAWLTARFRGVLKQ